MLNRVVEGDVALLFWDPDGVMLFVIIDGEDDEFLYAYDPMTDKLHFIVGLAVNPQQVDDGGVPLRKGVVENMIRDLEARGKLVSVEYV